MGSAATKLMEPEAFLAWCQTRDERWELVDGIPLEMMTGASGLHDRIVTNVIISLGNQLRGGPCRPTTADIAFRTRIRTIRRPDVTVTCDPPRGDVFEPREPRLVVEVLSPSNKGVAWERKMRECRQHERLDYILLIDSEIVAATLYTREGQGWEAADFERRAEAIELPRITCRLSMSEVYEGTELQEDPEIEA